MRFRYWLLAASVSSGIAAICWGWWQANELKIERLEGDLADAQADARNNLATANTLKSTLEREREDQTKLRQLQGELRAGLASRERLIETLTHENEELRNWADQPLPAPARRMRQRPAITGAAAYRQWLSGSGPVPASGDGAGQERPVAQ